jgi:hypothetical protein
MTKFSTCVIQINNYSTCINNINRLTIDKGNRLEQFYSNKKKKKKLFLLIEINKTSLFNEKDNNRQ